MDTFIESSPFFTVEQRTLATSVARFVEREIERRTAEEEQDIDGHFRTYLGVLADSGLLRYAVAYPAMKLDVRSLCVVREALAYSSSRRNSFMSSRKSIGDNHCRLREILRLRKLWS